MSRNAIDRESALRRARRTRKLTRNNVEALEPRVLLSAHGAGTDHEPQGRAVGHDKGVETVELYGPQSSADLTVDSEQDGPAASSQDAATQITSTSESVGSEAHPLIQHGPNFILPFPGASVDGQTGSDDPTQTENPSTSDTGPQVGDWHWSQGNSAGSPLTGDLGTDGGGTSDSLSGSGTGTGSGIGTISGIPAGSGGVNVIDIIFVNPIPIFPLGTDSAPTGRHPLNNGGSGSNSDPGQWTGNAGGGSLGGGNSGGTQQPSQGNNSGQTGAGKTPSGSGNQSNPPTQQGNDNDNSDPRDPQGRPLIQHGPGTPPPVFDPQNSGGTGTPTTPTTPQVPFGPVAKPVTPAPDSSAAVAVTPLALTPARGAAASSQTTTSAASALSIVTVSGNHDSTTSSKSTGIEASTSAHIPMQLVAVMPPGSAIGKAIDAVVPAAARAVAQQVQTAGAVVTGVEALTADALVQSLPAKATYNFIRFDPASFQDAMAAFANELASITKPAASRHSTTRAWIITGTVLGLDTVLLGYWRLKTRKQKKTRLALARAVVKPRPGRRD